MQRCIENELKALWENPISETELTKVKNNIEVKKIVSEVNVLNKAMNLAYCEMLGDAELINVDADKYQKVTTDDIIQTASQLFVNGNSSTIHYKSSQNQTP